MKLPQYRNREPLEYRPHHFISAKKIRESERRFFVPRRKARRLPGIVVGVNGILLVIVSEFIHESLGTLIFMAGFLLFATGVHFEIVNRIHLQQKYLIVPVAVSLLLLAGLIFPRLFRPILPRQDISRLIGFAQGFPVSTDSIKIVFGSGTNALFTFTRADLMRAKTDSTKGTASPIPFTAYMDKGRLFFNADIFVGADLQPLRIRQNEVRDLPFRWDGNYSSQSLEIVNADTVPVFQLSYASRDSIIVKGIFPIRGGLAIADESGLSYVKGNRVLFYGNKRMFRYPSWKSPI